MSAAHILAFRGGERVPSDLAARAARLWPDSPRNQAEWLRAVSVVRKTSGGWLLDRKVERAA